MDSDRNEGVDFQNPKEAASPMAILHGIFLCEEKLNSI
jgi:hypothetical protein